MFIILKFKPGTPVWEEYQRVQGLFPTLISDPTRPTIRFQPLFNGISIFLSDNSDNSTLLDFPTHQSYCGKVPEGEECDSDDDGPPAGDDGHCDEDDVRRAWNDGRRAPFSSHRGLKFK